MMIIAKISELWETDQNCEKHIFSNSASLGLWSKPQQLLYSLVLLDFDLK